MLNDEIKKKYQFKKLIKAKKKKKSSKKNGDKILYLNKIK
jgi:hypothetical protein